jgi:hypothetical protein
MMAGQFVGPCRLAARHGTTSSNPISSSGESSANLVSSPWSRLASERADWHERSFSIRLEAVREVRPSVGVGARAGGVVRQRPPGPPGWSAPPRAHRPPASWRVVPSRGGRAQQSFFWPCQIQRLAQDSPMSSCRAAPAARGPGSAGPGIRTPAPPPRRSPLPVVDLAAATSSFNGKPDATACGES